ncbi:MAG: VOC family protein, partial [Gemmatimonadales bacterium]
RETGDDRARSYVGMVAKRESYRNPRPPGTFSAMKKITPVLIVDAIEPVLPFWIERLGFEKTVEVPEGKTLGFVILQKGNVEVMYQSKASVAKDLPKLAKGFGANSAVFIYIEVADIQAVQAKIEGAEVVVPLRKTFYGATEIWVREPGGHVVGFAQQGT